MESDNRQTAGQKRQRVGFDSSASESSDSESDGSSDTDTDTDSDTEEEDSGFLNRKPVRAKQKVCEAFYALNQFEHCLLKFPRKPPPKDGKLELPLR
ncbi:hypothetical protein AWC38_SpisGene21978 [Stylophora pistillata]|uniref:Uncharacterized protein n=1 Tax=Stylophora pistillata TaxID=50429 RepID=A0A2B4RCD0_STYPI|nr:hypothetical protein AWC38_SpisGene21978 [Stylophora pistillata]